MKILFAILVLPFWIVGGVAAGIGNAIAAVAEKLLEGMSFWDDLLRRLW